MGTDLALLPVTYDEGTLFFSHTRLNLERSYSLFSLIREIKSTAFPGRRFSAYAARVPDGTMKGEACYGFVERDAYGDDLRFVRAGDLAAVLNAYPDVTLGPVAAFVSHMPALDWVALYWH